MFLLETPSCQYKLMVTKYLHDFLQNIASCIIMHHASCSGCQDAEHLVPVSNSYGAFLLCSCRVLLAECLVLDAVQVDVDIVPGPLHGCLETPDCHLEVRLAVDIATL